MSNKPKAYILGGGLTGLTIGAELKDNYEVIVLEQRHDIGGLCQTFRVSGINHEFGPHILYTKTKDQQDWWEKRLTNNLKDYFVRLSINGKLDKNSLFDFPISENNLKRLNVDLNCVNQEIDSTNFENYMISQLGIEAYNCFVKNYNIKQWGIEPKNMSSEWCSFRPLTIHKKSPPKMFGDKWAGHPKSYRQFFDNLSEDLTIIKDCEVLDLKILADNKCHGVLINSDSDILEGQKTKKYIDVEPRNGDVVINTLPIDKYFKEKLDWRGIIKLYYSIKIDRPVMPTYSILKTDSPVMPTYSTTFPNNYSWTRIVEYAQQSGQEIKDKTIISTATPFDSKMTQEKINKIRENSMIEFNNFAKNEIKKEFEKSYAWQINNVYPVSTNKNINKLEDQLKEISSYENVYTAGRLGLYAYISMANAVEMAIKTSKLILSKDKNKYEFYKELRKNLW